MGRTRMEIVVKRAQLDGQLNGNRSPRDPGKGRDQDGWTGYGGMSIRGLW